MFIKKYIRTVPCRNVKNISGVTVFSAAALFMPLMALAAILPATCSELLTFLSSAVAKTLAAFIGAIAIIMLLIAAFQFLTAGGDSEKVKDARSTVTWAIIGIAVALISFNIPRILSSFLGGALPTVCQ